MTDDWYEKQLREYAEDGAKDADRGHFDPPYPGGSDDPQDQDANWAYQGGFNKRRHQLGNEFRWA